MYDAYDIHDAREQANEALTIAGAIHIQETHADEIRELMAQLETANEIAAIHRAERDAYLIELAKLRDRCQVLILEKEEIRHTYQKHLGAYLRLVRESMHDALDAGIVPERLADDVNALRAAA